LNWLSFNESFSLISACLTERALAVVEKWKKRTEEKSRKTIRIYKKNLSLT
jgi:hypothetical protein